MSPYKDPRNDTEQFIYSAGLGVRTKMAFFDLSYSRGNRTEVYGIYSPFPGTNEVSMNQLNPNNVMVTLGFKF